MGLGLGEAILKDMKVLIGQRGNREVYAEGERLWNGQAFLHFDCLCASANQKTGERVRERTECRDAFKFSGGSSRKLFVHVRRAGSGCDVAVQAVCKFS